MGPLNYEIELFRAIPQCAGLILLLPHDLLLAWPVHFFNELKRQFDSRFVDKIFSMCVDLSCFSMSKSLVCVTMT